MRLHSWILDYILSEIIVFANVRERAREEQGFERARPGISQWEVFPSVRGGFALIRLVLGYRA